MIILLKIIKELEEDKKTFDIKSFFLYNIEYFLKGRINMYFDIIEIKHNFIIFLSLIILIISVLLQTKDYIKIDEGYNISYEYINIKDMAQAKIVEKTTNNSDNIIENVNNIINDKLGNVEEVDMGTVEEVDTPIVDNAEALELNKSHWRLPIEEGQITQYPNSWHIAYDMISPKGYGEVIHPIANGVVSSIYTDNAGALIVMVNHGIDGIRYTSQYVHLSSYAEGLYVGQNVTINDSLGQMGSSGNSTGVHLHITLVDCALNEDDNCPNLGSFFEYVKRRFNENFFGLGVVVNVPDSWYNFNE